MMRQLTFLLPGKFEWRDVAAPRIASGRQAIVRPLAVARCDLDLYIAIGAAPFGGPFAFGHEAVAEVVDAGEDAGVKPGDRVVVPFQISCGACDNCQRGYTNSCSAVPLYSAYGLAGNGRKDFGGALADLMLVPFADHMLVPMPHGVDPVVAASACDNIADGWRGVAPHLAARPGASVLVVGGLAQSVGIYAAGSAVALGAGRVLYLDDNAENRKRASALGADVGPLALGDGREASEQFDIVVEAAGNAPDLAFAVRSTAANGTLTSVSMHFDAATPVPLNHAYYKGLTFYTGRVQSRPLLPDVLGCIACGKLHPEHVTHRVASFDEAGEAMADPGPKLVFVP
jgi:threonine dehydrogenase-like Zn-dependent dehydrogenase